MLARPSCVVFRPSASAAKAEPPLFSFGVIADVQYYADIPDGRSFLGVPRYYRAPQHLRAPPRRAAVERPRRHQLLRQLRRHRGRILPQGPVAEAVQAVVREFDSGFRGGPTYHMLGNNHCLYNLSRADLVSVLRMPTSSTSEAGRAYYDFSPWPGYRFVVLDAYDFSAVGWPRGVRSSGRQFLEKRNPNHDKNNPSGLEGTDRRFVMFNGRRRGRRAAATASSGARAVVCSHLPVHPGARGVTVGADVELRGGDGRARSTGTKAASRRASPGTSTGARVRRGRTRRAPPHPGGRAGVPARDRRVRARRGVP